MSSQANATQSGDTQSHSQLGKLIYMANQIGKFFMTQGEAGAVEGIATHLKKFWDPRMRKAIVAHLDTGGDGLDPPVKRAVEALRVKN
jgi:formate dehydrogenase subunit delta